MAILHLTPSVGFNGPVEAVDKWPLAPSDPPIMIPAIAADDSLFPMEKIEAHIRGQLHLALSVFLFDGDRLLVQRRALSKYHCGGQWANTCCTHPLMGEDLETAARRRMKEELGITIEVEPRRIVEYAADVGGGLREHERVHMFRAEGDADTLAISLNPDEVCETRWVTARELTDWLRREPSAFTPWFRLYVNRFPELDF